MLVFAAIEVETELVGLVSDAVPDFGAEHHLVAVHEVEHHVLQVRLISDRVYEIEVHILVRGDLDALVALDEVDEALDVEGAVVDPVLFLSERVPNQLKEQNLARAAHHQSLVVDQVHRAEVFVADALEQHLIQPTSGRALRVIRGNNGGRNPEGLALSIETVNLVVLRVVEALVREVLVVAL